MLLTAMFKPVLLDSDPANPFKLRKTVGDLTLRLEKQDVEGHVVSG
jgi:hypothetical protein